MTTHDVEPSDAEYLARARAGDADAFAALFARHHEAAHRTAARLTTPDRAEDLVAEAFARIYGLLRAGRGPTATFRAYLIASVRNMHVDHVRRDLRHAWMSDLSGLGDLVAIDDETESRFSAAAIGRAFRSLPERWQAVLWFTAIEDMPIPEVADLLGINPHAASQLVYRAREGLRQQYLAEHMSCTESDGCGRVVDLLPGYVRGGLTGARSTKVTAHLAECLRCSAAVAEIAAVNKDLGLLLLPLALGSSAPDPGPPAGARPRAWLAGAVLGTVVAVGVAVLLWPPGETGPSAVPTPATILPLVPRPSPPSAPSARPAPARVAATPARRQAAPRNVPRPTPSPLDAPITPGRPTPLAEDLVLGSASAERVDPARPGVLHVRFSVVRAVRGAEAVLTVTPVVTRTAVHREQLYGDWRCGPRGSLLVCRLASRGGDLAVDLWVRGPGTASLSLSLPDVVDPSPGDNRATVGLTP